MTPRDSVIVVVGHSEKAAANLKELIEFMDTPAVCSAGPDGWREAVGERRLDAVFVGADLPDNEVERLFGAVGEIDPNVPIVLLDPESSR